MTLTKFKPSTHLLRDIFTPTGIDSMLNGFFSENGDNNMNTMFFRPSVDVVENKGDFTIQVSLPGVQKDDITIDMKNRELTISGERKSKSESNEGTYHIGEIRYGKFSRTFYLPETVNSDKVEAEFKDGILSIVVPKMEEAKPKAIVIK
ncbi:MAG: Hsp20 family protein [Bacteroidetes bacterium]|nr:Hsp20 family protein [Bacteroidota bacterium]